MSNTLYTTLTEVKNRLDPALGTGDDSLILDTIEEACRALDMACGRWFYPKIATLYFDFDQIDELKLKAADLLSVTTLLTSADYGSGTAIAAANYWLACGESYNHQPYDRVLINPSSSDSFDYFTTQKRSQSIAGVWGYHDDYTNAWVASGATLGAAITTATATSATVSNGAAFERGQTIKIDDEFIHISNISSNTLTIERGLNGSTAATHLNSAAISIYKPITDIQRIATRYALWLYEQNKAPFSFEVSTGPDGSFHIPQEAPPEVHRFIKRYRRIL